MARDLDHSPRRRKPMYAPTNTYKFSRTKIFFSLKLIVTRSSGRLELNNFPTADFNYDVRGRVHVFTLIPLLGFFFPFLFFLLSLFFFFLLNLN